MKDDFTVKTQYRQVGETERVDRVVIEVFLTYEAETDEEIDEVTVLAEWLQENRDIKSLAEFLMSGGDDKPNARPFRIH